MSYHEGLVIAVPVANKAAYIEHAARFVPLFKEFGATRVVEAWGDAIPDGKVTDFKRAVRATPDEAVVLSWIEYPSKSVRDAASQRLTNDPRAKELGAAVPFDGQRMIFGGFAPIVEEGAQGKMGYTDGFVVPVPIANKNAYRDMAAKAAAVFREYGAIRIVEAWGDDIPDGKVTDFKRAVQANADEQVIYSWIEWPSREHHGAAWPKIMADERMKPDHANMPFDGRRMIYGSFAPILDS
jgi:uncharacterized protein YbaA (DUF1428 family)